MKSILYIISLLSILTLGGCLKEEKIDQSIQVKLEFPAGFENTDPSSIEIAIMNLTSGLTYRSTCNAEGIATFRVEYGFYQATTQYKHKHGVDIDIFNGRIERMILTSSNGDNQEVYTLPLVHAKLQQLVIKELYYAGCKSSDGSNKNYMKDSYITIYNNSEDPAILDSLCVGMVYNMTTNNPSSFITAGITDKLPVMTLGWQIFGNGSDYILQPGEEVSIAINAINHTAIIGYANSVDLSHVKFVFWDASLAQNHQKEADVIPLSIFWKSNSPSNITQYGWGSTGPGIILYRIKGMSAETFAANKDNEKNAPGTASTSTLFLMIPTDWVVDGIDCISENKPNKRFPATVDAGYITCGSIGSGLAVHRKIEETTTDGRIIYQDSNNTTEDFETGTPWLKH